MVKPNMSTNGTDAMEKLKKNSFSEFFVKTLPLKGGYWTSLVNGLGGGSNFSQEPTQKHESEFHFCLTKKKFNKFEVKDRECDFKKKILTHFPDWIGK